MLLSLSPLNWCRCEQVSSRTVQQTEYSLMVTGRRNFTAMLQVIGVFLTGGSLSAAVKSLIDSVELSTVWMDRGHKQPFYQRKHRYSRQGSNL